MIADLIGRPAHFLTDLPPAACVERLKPLFGVIERSIADDTGMVTIAGFADRHALVMRVAHPKPHEDSEISLYAQLIGQGSGSLLRGRFRTARSTRNFMFGFVAGQIGFAFYIGYIAWSTIALGPRQYALLQAAPVMMLIVVGVLGWFGAKRARRDEALIVALLADRIGARRVKQVGKAGVAARTGWRWPSKRQA